MIKLLQGDCLKLMFDLPDNSVDMICCDMPYGTTACKWDTILPLDMIWHHYKRICKETATIVLNASQPFTTTLINSNLKWFKYEWIWQKERGTGFQIAKYRPMMETESCLVFCKKTPKYNPQMIPLDKSKKESFAGTKSESSPLAYINKGSRIVTHRYPKNIIKISRDKTRIHPTQKHVALIEYLIKTYTNEGDTVLDNCMGSGTTGVACKNLNRNFIGIELDDKYFQIAKERIEAVPELETA